METKEHSLTEFNEQDLEKLAQLGAENFTRPKGMSKGDFVEKIKQELFGGGIEVKVRETILKRKFARSK